MWKILRIRLWIGLFFKSNKQTTKSSQSSPAGHRCGTSVCVCYPRWAGMADSQVENFTALQSFSALKSVNQQSGGAGWQGPNYEAPAQASVTHLPLPTALPPSVSFLLWSKPSLSFSLSFQKALFLVLGFPRTPPWKGSFSTAARADFLHIWVPQGRVACWWLARAGF